MVSGYLTEKKYSQKVDGQKYSPVMGLVATLLGLVAIGGTLDMFGPFGDVANLKHDYFLLAFLCSACGLQNAAISSASGATLRTTHLTGLTTDLGLGLIRAEVHHLSVAQKNAERRANKLRISMIAAFTFGSVVAAFIFNIFQYHGFYFPMLISVYFVLVAQRKHH